MDFNNKVVIVTGASVGIGAATAVHFGNLSAKVVLVARSEDKLKEVAQKVEKAKGMKPLIVKADLTVDVDVKRVVYETIQHFGKIDVLINNAGGGVIAGSQQGIEALDKTLALNLRSIFLLTSIAIPHLIKSKGNIVNISSVAATRPSTEMMPYNISKAALDMFTKCIAKELGAKGLRVNSVNPGPTVSNFWESMGLDKNVAHDKVKVREEVSLLGKAATGEEVAEVISFLASDKARSITGSFYFIDNGFSYS